MSKTKKNRFYVVWEGREKGIFSSWDECLKSIYRFKGGKFKAFKTEDEANAAFYGMELIVPEQAPAKEEPKKELYKRPYRKPKSTPIEDAFRKLKSNE